MNIYIKSIFVTFVLSLFSICLPIKALQLTLAYADIESFPFQMGNGVNIASPPGLAVEIIAQAAADIGVAVKFVRFSNKRMFTYLEMGSIDGVFTYSYKKQRAKKGQYPLLNGVPDSDRRITSISYYLYTRKGSQIHWDGQQITGLKQSIGANAGYSIVDDLKQMGVAVNEYYGSYHASKIFTLLKMGRIDGVAAHDITTDPYLNSAKFSEIEKSKIPLKTKDYFLVFGLQFMAKHADIAEQLWQRISEIRSDKTTEVITNYHY